MNFIFFIIFWYDQPTEREKKCLYLVCIQNFPFNAVLHTASLPASPHSLFPHKDQAPTTLFPSVLTTSTGRDTKLHHHTKQDKDLQLSVYKSIVILRGKKRFNISICKLTYPNQALLRYLAKKLSRRWFILSKA